MARRPAVIVSGALANRPRNGGGAWARLNWLLGLRRLGCDVFFLEQIRGDTCVNDAGVPVAPEASVNVAYFRDVLAAFGLDRGAALIIDDKTSLWGLQHGELLDVADAADLLINISGHLTLESLFHRIHRKAYVDLDPGFTQMWQANGVGETHLAGHDFYFTVGENIGTPDCPIPTCGLRWRRKPRFVVLEEWPVADCADRQRFTTVAAWRGEFGRVEYNGRSYGLKAHEFRKFMTLPQRVPWTFEIALNIHPSDAADQQALQRSGWHLTDPKRVADDPFAFRRYVQQSAGEFSAAQGIYVDTRSGWLSDRTAAYLASGKPALVQNTGFDRNYPVGEGLVPFSTLNEAVAGAERIARDYERHARAARLIAQTHFNSDVVLPRLLEDMGIRL